MLDAIVNYQRSLTNGLWSAMPFFSGKNALPAAGRKWPARTSLPKGELPA
jgi:hypothetical protein